MNQAVFWVTPRSWATSQELTPFLQLPTSQAEQRDGHYLLRSNLTGEDPAVLWTRYVQLTQIENVFRSLKSELSIRPIGHQLEHRADAHVLVVFLAYSLQVTLKNRLMIHAPGLTPASVFEKLATIQMVEVWIPMVDGRWLVMPRHTQPEPDVQALLNQVRITLPLQPPPRIKGRSNHVKIGCRPCLFVVKTFG
jgi:hypothetical protein